MRLEILAYCQDCGFDLLSKDSDDLDSLLDSFEARADQLYQEHTKSGDCR